MELKNNFVTGKMNKDTNLRLLKDSEYIHAENVQIIQAGNNGVVKNFKGTTQKANLVDDLINPFCISRTKDLSEQNIYYFVAADNGSKIIEYDLNTEVSEVVLHHDSLLGFNQNRIIHGVNEINGLLFWCDPLTNAPRFCNIQRAKTYGQNGFTEDDISVALQPPFQEPTIQLGYTPNQLENDIERRFLSFCYRYRYIDEGYSTFSFYSDLAFDTSTYQITPNQFINKGMLNLYNEVEIFFNTGDRNVKEIELCFRETNSNAIYLIHTFDKTIESWGNNETKSFKVSNNKLYTLIDNTAKQLYSNFPREAKSQTIIGGNLIYANYVEGYDLIDKNNAKINPDYELDIIADDILEGKVVQSVINNTTLEFDFTDQIIKEGRPFRLFLSYTNIGVNTRENYSKTFSFTIPLNVNNVTDLSINPEWLNFVDQIKNNISDTLKQPNETLVSNTFNVTYSGNTILFNAPELTYSTPNPDPQLPDIVTTYQYEHSADSGNPDSVIDFTDDNAKKSLKSIRSYQVMPIYYDEYNRVVGILDVKEKDTIYIPFGNHITSNKIEVKLNHLPPIGATKYKFLFRENKTDYEVIYINKYIADATYIYFKLEGESRNKVKEDDIIVLKRYKGDYYNKETRIKVLEVTPKLSNFIADNKQPINNNAGIYASSNNLKEIIEEGGLYMKVEKVDVPYTDLVNAERLSNEPNFQLRRTSTPNGIIDFSNSSGQTEIFEGSIFQLYLENSRYKTQNQGKYTNIVDVSIIADRNYANILDFFNTNFPNNQIKGKRTETFIAPGQPAPIPDLVTDVWFTWELINNNQIRVLGLERGLEAHPSRFTFWGKIITNTTYVFETYPNLENVELYHETIGTWNIINGEHEQTQIILPHYNCYCWGNGIESCKIEDAFNKPFIEHRFRAWALPNEGFQRIHRKSDVCHSDTYRWSNRFNGLHNFDVTQGNFKELDIENAEIERIIARDGDLLVFQRQKIGKILFGKNIIEDLQGMQTLQAVKDVLGAYVGIIGINGTRNPESIVYSDGLTYCVDVERGELLVIANNEIEKISENLCEQYFREICKTNDKFIADYDPDNNQYLVFIGNDLNKVLSFQKNVGGFPTFHNYQPDMLLGVGKKLFSWKNGVLFENYTSPQKQFFGVPYTSQMIFNVNHFPSDDKVFKAIKLESSHAWDIVFKSNLNNTFLDKEEFNEKESFWFSHIPRAITTDLKNAQGIGLIDTIVGNNVVMKNTLPNYISVGSIIGVNANFNVGIITNINNATNTLTLSSSLGLTPNDFIFAIRNNRIDGVPIRGFNMQVDMTLQTNEDMELFSVSTEISKSFL